MMNGMKRLFATFAASTLLAASALVATPASAQASGDNSGGYDDDCREDISGGGNQFPTPYGCCRYEEAWGGWFIMMVTHMEPCSRYPIYSSPEPLEETAEPAGQ